MKKSFIAVLALAAVVACNKTDIVEQAVPFSIGFDNSFVDNATKSVVDPSTTTNSLNEFTVYGFMTDYTGVVFDGTTVSKAITNTDLTSAWKYNGTQYWVPGKDYYFAAIAGSDWTLTPATNDAVYGVGTIAFENKTGENDLLYAAEDITTPEEITDAPAPVSFTFNHLLSKVKFAFTNGFEAANMYLAVSDVKMTVPSKASINLAQEDWWSTNKWVLDDPETNTIDLDFGVIGTDLKDPAKVNNGSGEVDSYYERLTIPTDARTYQISFTATLYQGKVQAGTYTHTASIEGIELKMGHAYKFTAELNGANINPEQQMYPIEFTVSDTGINGWEQGKTYDGGQIDTQIGSNN